MLTFWPRIGETETLYSISARLHYLRGCNSSELTSKWLYGFATAAGLKDIPRNLGHITETVQGLLGTAPEALRQRTLVGLYLRFMEPAPAQHFLDWCVSPRSAIRPYVGLRATGLPAQHPLRACPDCMVVDRDTLGCATWRLEHQLPAVLVCPWHGRVLHTVQRSVGSKRDVENTWVRPEDVSCQGRFMGCAIADEDMQWWTEFARSAWLLQSHPRASTEVLRTILSTRLAHIGVIPSGRKLDLQALEPWWVKRRPPNIGAYPGLASFSASTWIRDLLLRRRFGHPVRWLMLCTAIMSSDELASKLSSAPCFQATLDGRWQPFGDAREDTLSPRVWEMLLQGMDIADVSSETGLSAAKLRHALRLNSKMHAARADALRGLKLKSRRAVIQNFLVRNPAATRAHLAQVYPAELRWLETNDRDWVVAQMSPPGTRRFGQLTLNL